MNLVAKVIAHLLFVCGLFVFIVLPNNKYSWMQEMDPSILIDDPSNDRIIFTSILLIIIVVVQLAIVVKTSKRAEKIFSIVLVLVAVTVWSLRYLFAG